MADLRVATINAKGTAFPVRFMMKRRQRRRPDVVATQELYRLASTVDRLFPTWRNTGFLRGASDMRRGSKDNPIFTRRGLVNLGEMIVIGSKASTPERLAPDRFIHVSAFLHDVGPTAVINIHPHAATMGHARRVDRANETARFIEILKDVIRFWRNNGFHVVVVGDGNWRPSADSPDWQDLAEMLRQLRMEYHFHGIDFAACTGGLEIARVRTYSRKRVRSDHPGLLVDFRLA